MRSWSQVIIILAFVVLPVISKIVQSYQEKRNAERERRRQESASANPAARKPVAEERTSNVGDDMRLPGTQPVEKSRRAELQHRREAQLAEWRARQAESEGRAGEESIDRAAIRTGVGGAAASGGKGGLAGDLLSAQAGGKLISSMIERIEQQTQLQRQKRPSRNQPRPTSLAEHQRQQHSSGSESEATVHRLVLSDEELAAKHGIKAPQNEAEHLEPIHPSKINAAGVFHASRSPEAMRHAFILKEVLDRPLALRHEQA